MSTFFWSFMAGVWSMVVFQWILLIPFRRKHRVIRALLDRAKMYQQRAEVLDKEGKEAEALHAYAECRSLLEQIENFK